MGSLIAEALDRVGADGVLSIETSNSLETSVDVQEGMQIDRGYISPQFITNQVRVCLLVSSRLSHPWEGLSLRHGCQSRCPSLMWPRAPQDTCHHNASKALELHPCTIWSVDVSLLARKVAWLQMHSVSLSSMLLVHLMRLCVI